VLALSASDAAYIALAVFLVAVGLALAYAFVRLGGTFARLTAFLKDTQHELVPVIAKVGGTVDRVNGQLDKADLMTDSAVDAVDSVDTAVRAVSFAVQRPVQKITGFAAGVTHGIADLKANRDWRGALASAKAAARQREQELAEELRTAGRTDPEQP
jgi:uncharacterized protein YoxC